MSADADPRPTCATCRWWDNSAQSALREPDTTGQCRGAAPTVDHRTKLGVWPFTEDCDWCRAWEQADATRPAAHADGGGR